MRWAPFLVRGGRRRGGINVMSSLWWSDVSTASVRNKLLKQKLAGHLPKADLCFCGGKKTTPGFWKRDQRDTEVIPLKECHRWYPDELVNVNRLLCSLWRTLIYDKDQWEMSRRPSWLDRRRLSNQDFFFWDNHLSGHPAHLVDSATRLEKENQASAAESEDSFYPPDLLKVNWAKWANQWRMWKCQQLREFGA